MENKIEIMDACEFKDNKYITTSDGVYVRLKLNIETIDRFTTLDQSKKLKKLGIPQESEFYWVEFNGVGPGSYRIFHRDASPDYQKNHRIASAFIPSELVKIIISLSPNSEQDEIK